MYWCQWIPSDHYQPPIAQKMRKTIVFVFLTVLKCPLNLPVMFCIRVEEGPIDCSNCPLQPIWMPLRYFSSAIEGLYVFGLWETYCTLYPWMKPFWYQYFAILAKGQRGAKSLLANVQHRGFVGWCTEPFKDANIGPKLHKSIFSFISEKSFTKSILKTTINTPTTKDLLAPT